MEAYLEILQDLDRESRQPLYSQIVDRVHDAVVNGRLKVGSRMPAERSVSKALHLSRTTVQTAYRELEADGLIRTQRGVGTFLCAASVDHRMATATMGDRYVQRAGEANFGQLDDLFVSSKPGEGIDLATGAPDPSLVQADMRSAIDDVLARFHSRMLQNSPVEGLTNLRCAIADSMLPPRGMRDTCNENIMVTCGATQALDLVARLFLEPGDRVIVENPTFSVAKQIFLEHGARLIGVPMTQDGLDLDRLPELIDAYRPKLIYLQPTLQNPTGVSMPVDARRRLLQQARDGDVVVIEDDTYGLLDEYDTPSLYAHGDVGATIHIGSFSKILCPGLRLGYVVASGPTIRQLARLKQMADLHASTISQSIAESYLRVTDVVEFARSCRRIYAARLATALSEIDRWPDLMRPTLNPAGGFYIFCRIRRTEGTEVEGILAALRRSSVWVVNGRGFSVDGQHPSHIRLSISQEDNPAIRLGLKRLVHHLAVGAVRSVA